MHAEVECNARRKEAGPKELLKPLLGLATSSLLTSLSNTATPADQLEPSDMEQFIADIAARFDGDGLEDVLGPVFSELADLIRRDAHGLAGTGAENGWRAGLLALEGLVAVKPVAAVVSLKVVLLYCSRFDVAPNR